MDPALLALLATTSAKLAQLTLDHVTGALTAEQALTSLAEQVKGIMESMDILNGDG